MLTGKQVRVRVTRDRVGPLYVPATDPEWLEVAERLVAIFRGRQGTTRGELEDEVEAAFGDDPSRLVYQGLAKLLEDRCEFEVVSGRPPEELRVEVFAAAARQRNVRKEDLRPKMAFDRETILKEVAEGLAMTPAAVDEGLFADLKCEQRLKTFKDISPERLLERYNVALAQAVLLRSTRVHVVVRGETPQRFRQLFRQVKFHRLVCEVEKPAAGTVSLNLDGPLSLFSATQKYGLQLALFLPVVLLCRDFELNADLLWGAQRRPKKFTLAAGDGLVSHLPDAGTYVPPELTMFAELFRKKIADWDIAQETDLIPLGDTFWVPDFRLVHRRSGKAVLLEILGFWRRSSAEKHLQRLKQFAKEPFLLAVSDQLKIDDAELQGLASGIQRFRQMPLPDEVARLAAAIITNAGHTAGPTA